MGLQESSRNTI